MSQRIINRRELAHDSLHSLSQSSSYVGQQSSGAVQTDTHCILGYGIMEYFCPQSEQPEYYCNQDWNNCYLDQMPSHTCSSHPKEKPLFFAIQTSPVQFCPPQAKPTNLAHTVHSSLVHSNAVQAKPIYSSPALSIPGQSRLGQVKPNQTKPCSVTLSQSSPSLVQSKPSPIQHNPVLSQPIPILPKPIRSIFHQLLPVLFPNSQLSRHPVFVFFKLLPVLLVWIQLFNPIWLDLTLCYEFYLVTLTEPFKLNCCSLKSYLVEYKRCEFTAQFPLHF